MHTLCLYRRHAWILRVTIDQVKVEDVLGKGSQRTNHAEPRRKVLLICKMCSMLPGFISTLPTFSDTVLFRILSLQSQHAARE